MLRVVRSIRSVGMLETIFAPQQGIVWIKTTYRAGVHIY